MREGTSIDAGNTVQGTCPWFLALGVPALLGDVAPPAGCRQDLLVRVLPYSLPPMEVLWIVPFLLLNV